MIRYNETLRPAPGVSYFCFIFRKVIGWHGVCCGFLQSSFKPTYGRPPMTDTTLAFDDWTPAQPAWDAHQGFTRLVNDYGRDLYRYALRLAGDNT